MDKEGTTDDVLDKTKSQNLGEALQPSVQKHGAECSPIEGAACGSIAGGFAAAVTTPLDVAKTRIMLSQSEKAPTTIHTLKEIYTHRGFSALFSGVLPRILWMTTGGFVFFGAYEILLALSYWPYSCKNRKSLISNT